MNKKAEKATIPGAMIEPLEDRRLLAASFSQGVLNIRGTRGDDDIRVRLFGGSLVVVTNGVTQSFIESAIMSVRIRTFAGDDLLRFKFGILGANVDGGRGNDTLLGGASNDTLIGSAGADLINGNAGSDSILGGAGEDQLTGGRGNDLLNGDEGRDTISGGRGTDLSIDIDDRIVDPDQADTDLNAFFGAFPGLFNDLFPNGNPGGGNGLFGGGGGGSIFGGGGSIFD